MKYISNKKWSKENSTKSKNYNNVLDKNEKIHHHSWLNKVNQIYSDEPSMKVSLLHALMYFTLSQYNGDLNAPAFPKLIAFFQTLKTLSSTIYRYSLMILED